MISNDTLEKLARQHQTSVFPNIVREYFQHVFLSQLYKLPNADKLLFKGGTALRMIYNSPRFSEDLDFSLFNVAEGAGKLLVEDVFIKVLTEVERAGIQVELGEKTGATRGGYFGIATFGMLEYQPVDMEVNVSARNGRHMQGEVDSVANDFVPTYTLVHLPQSEIVEEKVFGALLERKKPRDFYDLYFLMRKGMFSLDQKHKLAAVKDDILANARKLDFKGELGVFLPADQQAIIRDFVRALEAEVNRQVVSP